jgi:hypothetical protein
MSWHKQWDVLTKDPATGQPFKYLAIKGWDEWQETDATSLWVKDWVAKDENPKYFLLPWAQQWMMDRLRRMRAVVGQNLDNNPDGLLVAFRSGSRRGDATVGPRLLLGLVEVGFLCPTNQQDKKLKRVYKSRVDKNKERTNEQDDEQKESTPEVPPAQAPVTPATKPKPAPSAAPKTNGCPHNWHSGAAYCPECTPRPTIGGPAPKKPAAFATPAPARTLGFDPHTINEGLAGYTVEQIQKIVRYHWDESENSFWRDKTNTRDFFARNLPKMADAIPSYWLNPKRIGKKSFFHPKPGLNRNA